MAFSNLFKSDVGKGIAIGLGIGAVGLVLVPALRPAAKAALKSGILLFEKGREMAAEAGEALEDIVAEARADLAGQDSMGEVFENAADETVAAESEV